MQRNPNHSSPRTRLAAAKNLNQAAYEHGVIDAEAFYLAEYELGEWESEIEAEEMATRFVERDAEAWDECFIHDYQDDLPY